MEDPNYSAMPIPQLNSELIDEKFGKFYLDWLEEVHRQDSLRQYLNRKLEI